MYIYPATIDEAKKIFPGVNLPKEISGFIEKHRDFFIASIKGNLQEWVEKTLLDDQIENLQNFSDSLQEAINVSVDVRKNKINHRFPLACFMDAINGLEDKTEGRLGYKIESNRNEKTYMIRTREKSLFVYLNKNKQVTRILARELPHIKDIISDWEYDIRDQLNVDNIADANISDQNIYIAQVVNLDKTPADNLAASMSEIFSNKRPRSGFGENKENKRKRINEVAEINQAQNVAFKV